MSVLWLFERGVRLMESMKFEAATTFEEWWRHYKVRMMSAVESGTGEEVGENEWKLMYHMARLGFVCGLASAQAISRSHEADAESTEVEAVTVAIGKRAKEMRK